MSWLKRSHRAFEISNFCLRFNGIWRRGPENLATVHVKHPGLAAFNAIVTSFVIVFELRFVVNRMAESPMMAVGCFCLCMTRSVTLAKIMIFIWKRTEFSEIFEIIDRFQQMGAF
jgi:hypothetical protein